MKLIYCQDCHDLFKLSLTMRTCECGHVYGRYVNNQDAEVSEDAVSIVIGNTHLRASIEAMQIHTLRTGNTADRTSYCQPGHGLIELAWVRPNCGPGNPRSRVISSPYPSDSASETPLNINQSPFP